MSYYDRSYVMVALFIGLLIGAVAGGIIGFIARGTFGDEDQSINLQCVKGEVTFKRQTTFQTAVLISELAESQGFVCNVNAYGVKKGG